MRPLLLALLAGAAPALAQPAISGTLTAAFESFDTFGTTNTRLTISLQCALTCDASAPEKRIYVAGGVDAFFASAPTQTTGYVSSGFGQDPTGSSSYVSNSFQPGTAFKLKAKSATCMCGNRTGEGGYVDLESAVVAIPPFMLRGVTAAPGSEGSVLLRAKPLGAETVELRFLGAGLDRTTTLTAADFPGSQDTLIVPFTPTSEGMVTVTATLRPYGAAQTATFPVGAGTMTGGGGGGSGTGGGEGSDGTDGTDGGGGCASTALAPALCLGLALLRRRR